jgi:hypothetical protein
MTGIKLMKTTGIMYVGSYIAVRREISTGNDFICWKGLKYFTRTSTTAAQ